MGYVSKDIKNIVKEILEEKKDVGGIKNIYFVPFGQDNYEKKHHSMIAHVEKIPDTIEAALQGKQIQPVIASPF